MIGRGTTLDPNVMVRLGERDLVAQAPEAMSISGHGAFVGTPT